MVGPWFTTPWRLASQFHGAVAWRFRSPFPSHVRLPYATSRHGPIPSVPCTPYPAGLLCGPIPSLIPCLYPTRPPATLWRGPTGSSSIRGLFRAPSTGRSFPAPAPFPCPWPIPLGCCAAPSHPSSHVYTPSGHQQPCGAGPLDPHPSGDRFVRPARGAPFLPPPLSPVPLSMPWPHALFCPVPFSLHPVFFLGRLQPSGTGPPDPLPSQVRFARLALVAPFRAPSACVVCSLQDPCWVPLPGPRAPRYPCLSPTWAPVVVGTVLRCYDFFFAPAAVPRLPFCSVPDFENFKDLIRINNSDAYVAMCSYAG